MMGWGTTLFFVDASHSKRTTSIAEETRSTFLLNWRWYLKMDTTMLIHKRDTLLHIWYSVKDIVSMVSY